MNIKNKVDHNEESVSNDKSTFTALIQNIEVELYNVAKNKVSNVHDIDDIIQETIIKIYKNYDSLKNIQSFKPWAIKILLNECNKLYKTKYKEALLLNKIVNKNTIQEEDSSITNFENDLCFKELLKHLSTVEQNIFILHYQCNYSTKEISEILCLNENTIKSKLKRSKTKIKEKYMKGGDNKNEF